MKNKEKKEKPKKEEFTKYCSIKVKFKGDIPFIYYEFVNDTQIKNTIKQIKEELKGFSFK